MIPENNYKLYLRKK